MKSLFIAIAVFISANLNAQSVNFSGTWMINKEKIEWGQAPEYVLPRRFTVQQNKKDINFLRTVLDNQLGEHDYTERLSFDGTEQTTVIYSGAKRTSSLKWNDDKKTFTISTSNINPNQQGSNKITEIWSLIDDAKTLVVDRHVEQPDGLKYDIKAYYDKK